MRSSVALCAPRVVNRLATTLWHNARMPDERELIELAAKHDRRDDHLEGRGARSRGARAS
jgi:hypothetical protein